MDAESDVELERVFLREARERIRALQKAVEGGADERYAVFRHAHSLKGLAGTLGHDEVAALAADIVARLRDERGAARKTDAADDAAVREDVDRLEGEIENVADAIDEI